MMSDTWTTHHSGTVGGRPYEAKTYSEGGYRVSTTTATDYEGHVEQDDSQTLIIPPVAAGSPVDIDGETIEDVEQGLKDEGFASDEIKEIVGHFPQ